MQKAYFKVPKQFVDINRNESGVSPSIKDNSRTHQSKIMKQMLHCLTGDILRSSSLLSAMGLWLFVTDWFSVKSIIILHITNTPSCNKNEWTLYLYLIHSLIVYAETMVLTCLRCKIRTQIEPTENWKTRKYYCKKWNCTSTRHNNWVLPASSTFNSSPDPGTCIWRKKKKQTKVSRSVANK